MKHLIIIMILATMITLPTIMTKISASPSEASSTPNIYVSPASKSVQTGQEFTIDIDVDYVSNLYGYEIWMNFDNSKLNASAIDYDGFLNEPTTMWHQEVNNTGGYVSLAYTSLRPAPAKTGGSPPPLATVHFKAIGVGTSTLHLNKTLLADDQAITITHTTADGEVISSAGTGHDVAVTNVTSYQTIIGQGHCTNITVTIANPGSYSETFNVTAYANATVIAKIANITLASGNSVAQTIIWNTTGFAYSNYTLKAVADNVPGEANTSNNNFTDGWVVVGLVGDITGLNGWPDGKVDIKDISLVAKNFGKKVPPAPPNCDVTGLTPGVPDGKIDIRDISAVAKQFGKHYP
jgi:hypothetical protein